MRFCRVCQGALKLLLTYENMPKAAQYLPCKEDLDTEKGIDLWVCQCTRCGLVQLDNEPVPYYKEVIRAVGFSEDMKKFRDKQFQQFAFDHNLYNKKVVEIGCGTGDYLSLIKKNKIHCYGIEASKSAVQKCIDNGLDVYDMFIEGPQDKIPNGPFDAFFIMNFFEHLPNPNGTLAGISANLVEGGLGVVEVPNFDMMLRENLFSEFIGDHLFYFTHDTLVQTLQQSGFEVIECRETWYNYIIRATVKKRTPLDLSKFSEFRKWITDDLHHYINQFYGGVAAWGAGHQALAMLSLANLGDKIRYIIDDAPFKQNKYSPATHIPIVSSKNLDIEPVDAVIVMAASYSDEVARKLKESHGDKVKIAILREKSLEILN